MSSEYIGYWILKRFAEKIAEKKFALGKTKLQKLVFLLSELGGVDAGYRFSFNTHGPSASELLGDVDYLDRIGVLKIKEISGVEKEKITPGAKDSPVINVTGSDIKVLSEKIEKIISEFGDMSPKDLELISTLVYISKYDSGYLGKNERLVATARELRPSLEQSNIEEKIDRLAELGYLVAA